MSRLAEALAVTGHDPTPMAAVNRSLARQASVTLTVPPDAQAVVLSGRNRRRGVPTDHSSDLIGVQDDAGRLGAEPAVAGHVQRLRTGDGPLVCGGGELPADPNHRPPPG